LSGAQQVAFVAPPAVLHIEDEEQLFVSEFLHSDTVVYAAWLYTVLFCYAVVHCHMLNQIKMDRIYIVG
jgi:hypothetical protein